MTEHRTIRSFVRRAGRMTASQERAIDTFWPHFGVEFSAAPLDLPALFGRDATCVLEIGFGNGDSLVQQAVESPDSDFLGIEVHQPGVGHCLIRAHEEAIDNLRLIVHDAVEVLDLQIVERSLARINLYFPDPWPKKRHYKRRIVQPRFLELCATHLVPGGSLNIATDWANYAEHIDEIFDRSTIFRCAERREHDGSTPLDRPPTKFERRGLARGHKIWDWKFICV